MKKGIGLFVKLIYRTVFMLVVLYLLITAGKYTYNLAYNFIVDSKESSEGSDVEVVIPKGTSSKEVAKILKKKGLIKNELLFNARVRLSDYNGKFRHGTFTLNTGMNEEDIMKVLSTTGDKRETKRFTIPEGYSVEQIAKKLDAEGICTEAEFIAAVNDISYDYEFLKDIPSGREYKLQGYLFPDTYEIFADAKAKDIVETMLKNFNKVFVSEYYKKAEELGYSVDEIITIASLVEREARLDSERPIIAGVIYNRLNIDMPLQIDATIQYIKTNGLYGATRILYSDLEVDSKYNTYKYKGIPVGPIGNPGRKSIAAALYPESHDYLYYILIDESTGEHEFNRTLEEHNATKNKLNR